MRSSIYFLWIIVFLASGCSEPARQSSATPEIESSATYTGPIIDMHIHASGPGNPMFGQTHPPTLRKETYDGVPSATEQKKQTLAKFREHNIVKAVVTSGEMWVVDASERILIGGANKGIDALRKQHEAGNLDVIAEMSPFYAGKLADDPTQLPYYELAQELDIPVGIHIFPGGPNGGIHLMPQMLGAMRTYNAHPSQLEDVLVNYPKLKLYIMHGGWPFVEEVKALMYAHPNLYVDIAVVNWILPQEEFNAYVKSLVSAGFGERIMYGSDQMVWPEVISVGIETVNKADFLSLEQKEDIFFDNAATFLGLSEAEVVQLKGTIEK